MINKANFRATERPGTPWKDPRHELPEKDKYVLAMMTYAGGCIEEPVVMTFDGDNWFDECGCPWKVIAWMPIPRLPKNWTNRYKTDVKPSHK